VITWFAGQPLVLKIVLGGLVAIPLSWLLWHLWLRKYLEWQNVRTLDIEKRVGLKIEFIKTAAQILGGAFFLVTIWVAWQNLVVSQEKHKTDLFTKAIEQLGNKKLEVRLGGIYALERIARDSEKDHGPIMEVLTAFVRLHAPAPPEEPAEAEEEPAESGRPVPGEKKTETKPPPEVKPRADIQAILTVLGRRARTYGKGEAQRLDLRQTDLRRTDLKKAHLEGADLSLAHLEGADIQEAHLEGAQLIGAYLHEAFLHGARLEGANLGLSNLEVARLNGAHLEGAFLADAKLEWANLQGAHLEGAKLQGAHLKKANLREAHLEGTNLLEARLEGADLVGAHLEGAVFLGAHLKGADLMGADLRGTDLRWADLRWATGLTQKQIDSAIIDENTKLPDYLKPSDPDKAKPQ
jgi:uncharacterized protein YjbI with pentapeptide repeats